MTVITTHTVRIRLRSLLFTTVSEILDLQLKFQYSAVRLLTQQQVLNFVLADLEQNGGQGVFIPNARISVGMSRYTLIFFWILPIVLDLCSVPETGTFPVIMCRSRF